MITDNNKTLTQWAMDFALKNGAQSAKLVLYNNSSSSFELRNAKMDRLQQSTENGLSISLYVDGRYGSFSTNRLDKKELETLILNGIESTRYLAPDEARVLPDPSRYYKGGLPDLRLFDKTLYDVNPDTKVDLARAAAEEALGKDRRFLLWRWRKFFLPAHQQWFRGRILQHLVFPFRLRVRQGRRRSASVGCVV